MVGYMSVLLFAAMLALPACSSNAVSTKSPTSAGTGVAPVVSDDATGRTEASVVPSEPQDVPAPTGVSAENPAPPGSAAISNASTVEAPTPSPYLLPVHDPSREILVTRDNPALPTGCRPWHAAALITSFFDAINRGDFERVALYVPESFEFFSVSEVSPGNKVRNREFYDRDALLRYLSERRKHGERLRLIWLDIGSDGPDPEVQTILFAIGLRADDLAPGLRDPEHQGAGKGGIRCRTQQIEFWTVGTSKPTAADVRARGRVPDVGWCPAPKRWREGMVVACSASTRANE